MRSKPNPLKFPLLLNTVAPRSSLAGRGSQSALVVPASCTPSGNLAGKLLENGENVSNVSPIDYNLSIMTSNLNHLGRWGILWQHRPPRTNEPAPPHGSPMAPKKPSE